MALFNEKNIIVANLLNASSDDLAVDGSITPVEFSYTPPTGYNFECMRIMTYLEGSAAFSSELFANLTALTNGLSIHLRGVAIANIKDNAHFCTLMYDMSSLPTLGKTTQTLLGRFSLSKLTDGSGATIPQGKTISVVINDNLSTLVRLNVVVEGHLIKTD